MIAPAPLPEIAAFPFLLLASLLRAAQRRLSDDGEQDEPVHEQAQLFVWRLERAYQEATGGKPASEVFNDIERILPDFNVIGRAAVDWLNFVETLAQEAECTYGQVKGRGPLKASQVKAVLVHLALSKEANLLPQVPRIMRALWVETMVTWAIDLVVELLNHDRTLWQVEPRTPSIAKVTISKPLMWLLRIAQWLERLAIGEWIADKLQAAVLKANPLAPKAKAAIAQMSQSNLQSGKQAAESFSRLVSWVAQHRRQLIGMIQLISVSVREVEAMAEMSGPEKKQYAREIVLLFLKENGIIYNNISGVFAGWFIDWGIEFVVVVFRKRGTI